MNVADDVEMKDESKRITVYDFLGHSIFVGRNAKANERLVQDHKRDHPGCLWMHIVGRKGPTVILCVGSKQLEPEAIVMRYAASRALKLSGVEKGQVLFAPLEDVYKPEQATEGIFRTWRTNVIEL